MSVFVTGLKLTVFNGHFDEYRVEAARMGRLKGIRSASAHHIHQAGQTSLTIALYLNLLTVI